MHSLSIRSKDCNHEYQPTGIAGSRFDRGPAGHSGVQVGRSVQSRESRKPQVPGRWRDPCATIPSVGIGPAGLAPVIEGYVLAGGHSSRFASIRQPTLLEKGPWRSGSPRRLRHTQPR